MADLFEELKQEIARYDEWPTPEGRARVIHNARKLVQAVDIRAAIIEQLRQQVTPTAQALSELIVER